MKYKECPRCHQILPITSFYKDKTHKDRHKSYCKSCSREHNKEYRRKRLDNHQCYDCGKPIPKNSKYQRYCIHCYQKRLKMNTTYEQQRKQKGLCRQCGKNPIDYNRSKLHCTSCLDKRNG